MSDEAVLVRVADELSTTLKAQLLEDVVEVDLDCALTYDKLLGDVPVPSPRAAAPGSRSL